MNNTNIGVLFDMDGVIVDTNPYHKKAFDIFLKDHQINLSDEELKFHIYGRTNKEIMQYILKDEYNAEKANQWANEKESIFRQLYTKNLKPLNGLIEFLDQLKNNNIKAAVGTSAPDENMQMVIKGLNLQSYFSALLNSDDVTKGKPDPEIYLKAADRINIIPNNCIVFEDSLAGVKAGLAGGMKVIAISTTHTKEELYEADLVIKDFTEINIEILINLFHQ